VALGSAAARRAGRERQLVGAGGWDQVGKFGEQRGASNTPRQ
jgi:hypothetical protein